MIINTDELQGGEFLEMASLLLALYQQGLKNEELDITSKKAYYTPDEVCETLGGKPSTRTIINYFNIGRLSGAKEGSQRKPTYYISAKSLKELWPAVCW